jgi:hypothetical protein
MDTSTFDRQNTGRSTERKRGLEFKFHALMRSCSEIVSENLVHCGLNYS